MHKRTKIALVIAGTLSIIFGIMALLFLHELSDPEIEGESGRIGLGAYFVALIPVVIGILFIFSSKIKRKTSELTEVN